MSKPLAWSYSLLQAFETCPRRFKLTRITKEVQEPQSEAMLHGNEVHKSLELAVPQTLLTPAGGTTSSRLLPSIDTAKFSAAPPFSNVSTPVEETEYRKGWNVPAAPDVDVNFT